MVKTGITMLANKHNSKEKCSDLIIYTALEFNNVFIEMQEAYNK